MKLAFVFPGQGSQAVGMLRAFAGSSEVRSVFDGGVVRSGTGPVAAGRRGARGGAQLDRQHAAGDADRRLCGVSRVAGGGRRRAAISSRGTASANTRRSLRPGRSRFAMPFPWSVFRARAMQEAVPIGEGAMAAVLGLDDDALRAACSEAAQGEVVEAVNFNAPSQVVIAGHKAAVERGMAAAPGRAAPGAPSCFP